MCIESLAGNLGCLCFRTFSLKNQPASGFSVFVSSLSFADCFMGVYLAFVGVADEVFRGYYYLYEYTWISGVPCSVAGAMSLLSSKVAYSLCSVELFVPSGEGTKTIRWRQENGALGRWSWSTSWTLWEKVKLDARPPLSCCRIPHRKGSESKTKKTSGGRALKAVPCCVQPFPDTSRDVDVVYLSQPAVPRYVSQFWDNPIPPAPSTQ